MEAALRREPAGRRKEHSAQRRAVHNHRSHDAGLQLSESQLRCLGAARARLLEVRAWTWILARRGTAQTECDRRAGTGRSAKILRSKSKERIPRGAAVLQ